MFRKVYRVGMMSLALWALGPAALSVGRVEAGGHGFGGMGGGFGGHGFGGHGFGGMFHHPATNINFAIPAFGYYGDAPYFAFDGYYPGWGGWGWGPGWNYYYGGPFGGAGYSLDDIELLKQQVFALTASRSEAQNAEAAQAYQAANYYRQQAIATALSNAREEMALREKLNPPNAAPAPAPRPTPGHPTVPLVDLVDARGHVIWPAVATRNDARDGVDSTFRAVVQEYRKRGRASAASVLDARVDLYTYGRPALARVRQQRPRAGESFKDFLNNLDVSLGLMADPPAKDDEGSPGQRSLAPVARAGDGPVRDADTMALAATASRP
jgi:hypothetical protein